MSKLQTCPRCNEPKLRMLRNIARCDNCRWEKKREWRAHRADPLEGKPVLARRRDMINRHNAAKGSVGVAISHICWLPRIETFTQESKELADKAYEVLDKLQRSLNTRNDALLPPKEPKL